MGEIKDEFILSIREELRQAVSDVVSEMRESARERLRSLEELMERLAVRLEHGLPMNPTPLPGLIKVATKYPQGARECYLLGPHRARDCL